MTDEYTDVGDLAIIVASVFGTQGVVLLDKTDWGLPFLSVGVLCTFIGLYAFHKDNE